MDVIERVAEWWSSLKGLLSLLLPILAGSLIGYLFARAKTFREKKQQVYVDALPTISAAVFEPDLINDRELNRACLSLILYGSKSVAARLDILQARLVDFSRGDSITALQHVTAAMRRDLQIFEWLPWRRFPAKKMQHLHLSRARSSPDQ